MSISKVKYRLNGNNDTQPPINARKLKVELNPHPTNFNREPIFKVSSLDFEGQNVKDINEWIDKGARGEGVGNSEGMPFSVSLDDGDSDGELPLLDGYLVLNGAGTTYSCDFIKGMKVELRGKNLSLSKRSKSIRFDILFENGAFTTDDFIYLPYVDSSKPDYKTAAIITVTGVLILYQVRAMIQDVLKIIAEIASVLSAIAGILKAVTVAFGVVVTVGTIVVFVFKITDQLIQPVKYHAAMNWKRLLEIGCIELGYTFQSSIFDDPFVMDTVILPAKYKSFEDPKFFDSFGFVKPDIENTTGYYDGSFFELLQDTKTVFNAFINITTDNRLIIETIGTPTTEPAFRMNRNIKVDEHTTNAHELIASDGVELLTDTTDTNTLDNYEGTVTHAITTVNQIDDPKAMLLNGRNLVKIPFARGSIKKTLTRPEKRLSRIVKNHSGVINGLIIIVNIAISIRNLIVSKVQGFLKKLSTIGINIAFNPKVLPLVEYVTPDLFTNRIGMLLLSGDNFKEKKLIAINKASSPRGTKLKSNNESQWHSKYVFNKYHLGRSHVPTVRFPMGNQKRGYKAEGLKVCKNDLKLLVDNPIIFAPNGQQAKLISFESEIETGIASIKYEVGHVDNRNYRMVIVTPPKQ